MCAVFLKNVFRASNITALQKKKKKVFFYLVWKRQADVIVSLYSFDTTHKLFEKTVRLKKIVQEEAY